MIKNNKINVKKNKQKKKSNLTMGMVQLLIICLLIPIGALSVVLFYFTEKGTTSQNNETVITSIENAAENCDANIEKVIDESKKASYDNVIRTSYLKYLNDKSEATMYKTISRYLSDTYKYNAMISSTMILFNEKTTMEYYTYSNVAGATYASISDFKYNAQTTITKVAQNLETSTKFVSVGEHLYLVRNLVKSNFQPFAVIVMEINKDNMFKSMDNVVWQENRTIYLEKNNILSANSDNDFKNQKVMQMAENRKNDFGISSTTQSQYNKDEYSVELISNANDQQWFYYIKLNETEILSESYTLIYVYVGIILVTLVLVALTFYYFYKNINRPISDLMEMSVEIEDGQYGITIPEFNDNQEFGKLIDTFNNMSLGLEESFNRIYAEEVALRDANMQALQAQINPHFLNNTLEIINWKARMSGNKDVSGMIESLGVMMEATMNRKKQAFIPIEEEMTYVDAYIYIIQQRFGSRFSFTKEVDERLLKLKIPRLIVQPIVENAVEHGGDKEGNKVGKLEIFDDYNYLYIVVYNNGIMTKEDEKNVEILLGENKPEENVHNIGIRNVNLRLKLLYGEESGLTIENTDNNLTKSTIKIDKFKIE